MSPPYGQFATTGGDMSGVNPTELTMGSMNQYGSNMSNSFMGGGGAIDDDDLLAIGNLDENQQYANGNSNGTFNSNNGNGVTNGHGQSYFTPSNPQMYSHTPDTNPIASPFANQQFDYNQYRVPNNFPNGARRSMPGMDRHPSDSRSPMTPTTPGLRMHHGSFGTPDSSLHHQTLNRQLHDQAKFNAMNQPQSASIESTNWDSPLASPTGQGSFHPQISEIMHSKHASLPAKVENGVHGNFQSQEAKKSVDENHTTLSSVAVVTTSTSVFLTSRNWCHLIASTTRRSANT